MSTRIKEKENATKRSLFLAVRVNTQTLMLRWNHRLPHLWRRCVLLPLRPHVATKPRLATASLRKPGRFIQVGPAHPTDHPRVQVRARKQPRSQPESNRRLFCFAKSYSHTATSKLFFFILRNLVSENWIRRAERSHWIVFQGPKTQNDWGCLVCVRHSFEMQKWQETVHSHSSVGPPCCCNRPFLLPCMTSFSKKK